MIIICAKPHFGGVFYWWVVVDRNNQLVSYEGKSDDGQHWRHFGALWIEGRTMLNVVKISGKPGSGKSQLLAMIAAKSLGRNYLMVTGDSTPDGIAQALRGRRDVVLCIDDCPAGMLKVLAAHPELGRGDRVTQVYAVVAEPVVVLPTLRKADTYAQRQSFGPDDMAAAYESAHLDCITAIEAAGVKVAP